MSDRRRRVGDPRGIHGAWEGRIRLEIENEAFVGWPTITVTRVTEEHDVVIAEGAVRTERKEGGFLYLQFCDVFVMRGGRIRRLVSYLMPVDRVHYDRAASETP